KTGKYFKYAIGEIILVVIGILIALQINNWNEQRKIQGNQEKYLILLKSEAHNNLIEVNKAINFANTLNQWQTKIFKLIDGTKDTITENYLSKAFSKVFRYTNNFRYENSALSELKSSGDLKYVLNDSLRKYLIALEPLVLKVQGQEKNVKQDYEDCQKYLKRNGSFRTIANKSEGTDKLGIPKSTNILSSNIHILSKEEFENNLITYTGTNSNLASIHYPRLKNHLKKIVEIIELELENK
uniref:DUF6090 family protein n=1 Tax=Bizionia psychrotolerans TaxID=1492901 RepID=UPI0006500667